MKCAICDCKGDKNKPLFKFPQLLSELRFDGYRAHADCLVKEQKACRAYKMKYGVDRDAVRM